MPPWKISVIPMPVVVRHFERAGERKPVGHRLLFVGRLVERKGAHVAIEALEVLKRKGREAHLTVVGDGPERDRLEALAGEKGVRAQIDFRGSVPAESVADAFAEADVFLMPALTDWKGEQEGFGLVLVEAMMSGVPVVASQSGGIPDVVTDEETGLLVPERDPEALAGAAARLLTDRALGRRLARSAAEDVRRRFAPEAIARRFEAVYRRAAAVGVAGT